MNLSDGLLGGNLKGDISVNVIFDPGTSLLLALLVVLAIVFSHVIIKFI